MATERQLRNRGRLLDALASLPVNFEWAFNQAYYSSSNCGSAGCAIGLAFHLHMLDDYVTASENAPRNERYLSIKSDAKSMADMLGINEADAYNVFLSLEPYGNKSWSEVTPADVAEALTRVFAWDLG